MTLKFSTQYPLLLPVNVGWRKGRALRSGGDKVTGIGLFLNDAEETS
jgi:hypothetical protein